MARKLELAWAERGGVECLRVHGWDGDELRRLRSGDAGFLALLPAEIAADVVPADFQPVAGTFELDGEDLWFQPRFPFRARVCYALLVSTDGGTWRAPAAERWPLVRPATVAVPQTVVVSIHPDTSVVPLNLLKFYIEFSARMSEGFAQQAITLRRADGGAISGAFASMEPELWDPDRRRLTILLDPGRIKRGLVPHEEAGYPLIEGERVTLHIAASFRDAPGASLKGPAARTFDVGPALRQLVVPKSWKLILPRSGTLAPLVVLFERPLDHALARHCLAVVDGAGAAVLGAGESFEGDASWRFLPALPWRLGPHVLLVDPRLEDLAGNSVRRLFDHDLTSDPVPSADASTVRFEIE